MGSDIRASMRRHLSDYFNPRSPDGERPAKDFGELAFVQYFNPRSPDGERPSSIDKAAQDAQFQSTLPGWGATKDFLHDNL